MPVVTTLHTVLREPDTEQRILIRQLDDLSNSFIVMAEQGKDFLGDLWHRDRHEINVSNTSGIRTNCIVPFSVE